MEKLINEIVEKWIKDNKINTEKVSLIKKDLDSAFTEVYEAGLDDGYWNGHDQGYDDGYEQGYSDSEDDVEHSGNS